MIPGLLGLLQPAFRVFVTVAEDHLENASLTAEDRPEDRRFYFLMRQDNGRVAMPDKSGKYDFIPSEGSPIHNLENKLMPHIVNFEIFELNLFQYLVSLVVECFFF